MEEILRLMDEEGIVDWDDKGRVYVFLKHSENWKP
jgi:hypothetical protein